MTPQEHIDAAEAGLANATQYKDAWDTGQELAEILTAIGHALIALAVENGAPHPTTPAGTS